MFASATVALLATIAVTSGTAVPATADTSVEAGSPADTVNCQVAISLPYQTYVGTTWEVRGKVRCTCAPRPPDTEYCESQLYRKAPSGTYLPFDPPPAWTKTPSIDVSLFDKGVPCVPGYFKTRGYMKITVGRDSAEDLRYNPEVGGKFLTCTR